MRDYYYEVVENGYYIKDRNSSFESLQYENEKTGEDYIFGRLDKSDKDYAKYAQMHIESMKKADAESEKERVSVEQLQKEIEIVKEDNNLTKSAIDTLMMMAMENSMPMMTLSAEEISSDKINTKQKGEDTMAAYIAKRCIDLETEKEGAGKDYYRLYLSSAVWGKYKEDVGFILADLGRTDLIVEL